MKRRDFTTIKNLSISEFMAYLNTTTPSKPTKIETTDLKNITVEKEWTVDDDSLIIHFKSMADQFRH